jgi:SpoVK/Ycf46/Vps4 family AAA+-type ATPase
VPAEDSVQLAHELQLDQAPHSLLLKRVLDEGLLILEDTGELLTADARAVIGQGLSRFLNVVDGLIGQGLRVLVLVTTNEAIRALHPAVARPGRCAANVEFGRLSAEEAEEWLRRHGVDGEVRAARTLAALYARAEGLAEADRPPTGFAE